MNTVPIMKYRYFFLLVALVTLMYTVTSCDQSDDQYRNYKMEIKPYEGSVLEYLESKTEYDSMLVVIDLIPGLRDSLSQENLTVFAVDNVSFETVLNQLNTIRNIEEKAPVYLEDLDIAELDTLMTRYIFKGNYNTEKISVNTDGLAIESLKFNYNMYAEYDLLDASGFVDAGAQRVIFSDPNESPLRSKWISTYTKELSTKVDNGIIYPLISGHSFGFDEFVFRFNK